MNLVKSVLIGFLVMCAWAPTAQATSCDACEDQYLSDLKECDDRRGDCLEDVRSWLPWVEALERMCRANPPGSTRDAAVCSAAGFARWKYETMKEDCHREWNRCESRACGRKDACEINCDDFEDS